MLIKNRVRTMVSALQTSRITALQTCLERERKLSTFSPISCKFQVHELLIDGSFMTFGKHTIKFMDGMMEL